MKKRKFEEVSKIGLELAMQRQNQHLLHRFGPMASVVKSINASQMHRARLLASAQPKLCKAIEDTDAATFNFVLEVASPKTIRCGGEPAIFAVLNKLVDLQDVRVYRRIPENARDKTFNSVLSMLRALIRAGVDVNVTNAAGLTPLEVTVFPPADSVWAPELIFYRDVDRYGHEARMMLLRAGARMSQKSYDAVLRQYARDVMVSALDPENRLHSERFVAALESTGRIAIPARDRATWDLFAGVDKLTRCDESGATDIEAALRRGARPNDTATTGHPPLAFFFEQILRFHRINNTPGCGAATVNGMSLLFRAGAKATGTLWRRYLLTDFFLAFIPLFLSAGIDIRHKFRIKPRGPLRTPFEHFLTQMPSLSSGNNPSLRAIPFLASAIVEAFLSRGVDPRSVLPWAAITATLPPDVPLQLLQHLATRGQLTPTLLAHCRLSKHAAVRQFVNGIAAR